MTSLITFDVPDVIEVQVVPSDEVRMVPESPTETYDLVVVPEELELLENSSFSPQEITVRLKRNMRIMCKNFFHLFPSSVIKGNKLENHIFIFWNQKL